MGVSCTQLLDFSKSETGELSQKHRLLECARGALRLCTTMFPRGRYDYVEGDDWVGVLRVLANN